MHREINKAKDYTITLLAKVVVTTECCVQRCIIDSIVMQLSSNGISKTWIRIVLGELSSGAH